MSHGFGPLLKGGELLPARTLRPGENEMAGFTKAEAIEVMEELSKEWKHCNVRIAGNGDGTSCVKVSDDRGELIIKVGEMDAIPSG
jgi:hypothetical protein